MKEKIHEPPEGLTTRQEIDALLPWFVAGTLSATERARVEAALAADPSLRASREAAEADFEAVLADNDARPVPGHDVLDRLMDRIEREAHRPERIVTTSLLDRFGLLLRGLAPRTLALAGVGLIALVLVQTAFVTASLTGGRTGEDAARLASGPGATASGEGAFVMVQFTEAATAAAVSAYLRDAGAVIVDGPQAGGLYRLRVAPRQLPADQLAARAASLAQRQDLVRSATAAP